MRKRLHFRKSLKHANTYELCLWIMAPMLQNVNFSYIVQNLSGVTIFTYIVFMNAGRT